MYLDPQHWVNLNPTIGCCNSSLQVKTRIWIWFFLSGSCPNHQDLRNTVNNLFCMYVQREEEGAAEQRAPDHAEDGPGL